MGKKKVGNQLRLPPQARTEKGRLPSIKEGSRGKALDGLPVRSCLLKRPAEFILFPMSTVTEIREAISKLNAEERELLLAELFDARLEAHENSPEFRAAIDEGLADAEAGRVYSIEEARNLTEQWISESSSQKKR